MIDTLDREPQTDINLDSFKLRRVPPHCPTTGIRCKFLSRKKIYVCETSDYSITTQAWDTVLLHSAVAETLLMSNGITSILWQEVAIPTADAVAATHFLPLFIQTANDMARTITFAKGSLLQITPLEDLALSSGFSLLDIAVEPTNTEVQLCDSLHLLTASISQAIKSYHEETPGGSTMDVCYIYDFEAESTVS